MEIIAQIVDIFLHIDEYLNTIIESFGIWSYLLLFAVIFMETGVVVTPFLPGDSLLFAVGTFAASGAFNIVVIFLVLFIAAVLGDTLNYWIGNKIGPRAFEKDMRFMKREYLERTEAFYEKHGGKTIFLARFIPIVRTFAPFVAGVGTMPYNKFLGYNLLGAFVWVGLFLFAGYFFGAIPFIQENFPLVIIVIVAISVLPMAYEFLSARLRQNRREAQESES